MVNKKRHTKLKSLSQGRPPTVKPARSISSKATRNVIRTYHTLEKERAKALAAGDDAKAMALAKQMELQGGIESYQRASLIGQTNERGGDSSKVLMEWLKPIVPALKELSTEGKLLRMLEVGALSVANACSKSHLFDMARIDLNSQAEGITQQDFMERPLPNDELEQFDIISLSLVLNYVPDPVGRGQMLLRTLEFLTARQYPGQLGDFLPSLFLVLPAPCVTNSRYLDENRLETIMKSLGFVNPRKKLSNKLVYYMWQLQRPTPKRTLAFKKEEIRSGKSRNNFAIVLR
ncbi:putative methyltransferase-domain-containing protein [Hyaloscypha finlandica]|jgi:25S rRNA (adenine2142-N1)-methyltransferase|nr:putative methyltransferase-domain-containing protein [Hyaloscypha finlandica]KAH8799001.1 putative methyltransferase-domain-containing protein [Hyaloscypha sp. PMI_1271]